MTGEAPVSLLELNRRLAGAVAAAPGLRGVLVVAETSDVRVTGGHCYLELIEKDPGSGAAVARARATIWRSVYGRIADRFRLVTGSGFTSGIKVMVRASVSFHPVYGMSLNIDDINPGYTLGDLLRRRREMIDRLTAEGIINLNRRLEWPDVPSRIAVISAAGAAGYGDFIHQLFTNPRRLRFSVTLFPAVMQGAETAPTILSRLDEIAARQDEFDCVVIIRGGGATGDLASFDHYGLAAHIALFPLPVMIGIGHERDITLLDYVANMRVKTPTAAAGWLIARGAVALDRLLATGAEILRLATGHTTRARLRLEAARAEIPALTRAAIAAQRQKMGQTATDAVVQAVTSTLTRHNDRLDAARRLADALSPQATLRRGFSITRIDGKPVTDASAVTPGAIITTTLASGGLTSVVK